MSPRARRASLAGAEASFTLAPEAGSERLRRVINKTIHVALGVNLAGRKEVLGLWLAEVEGAKFWLSVLTELQNRGLKEVFIACVDGLTGFPEAIRTVYPKTQVQLCIVHLVRNALQYVSYKDRRAVIADVLDEEQVKCG
jgi:transposase-like protein